VLYFTLEVPTAIEGNLNKTTEVAIYPNPFGSSFSISVTGDNARRFTP
jgi:hypothetical protein